MNLFTIVIVVAAIALTASAQVPALSGNFNVTSPTPNSPYVAQQILPCTYQLFQNVDTTGLTMNIDLISTATGSNVSLHIATNADMSKSSNSAKQNGNLTSYEHSTNYLIPTSVTPGSYKVSFSAGGAAPLDIPINILPAAASSSLAAKGGSATGVAGSSATGGSIFSSDAVAMPASLSLGEKCLMALTCVVGIALV
ncbi:hypothetical protein BCR42DRAFT_493097 [Absidia repens]|uniref:Ser-Thr-rich glycosyl-phosphatidyl-inositol-anchored membrane family-domain-containing protein n=1 Tax=Absidia repens TaxID=90262 RepID=A0A1X2IC81_9FUNG|nr:hypothetical protein BCR42DRAFT_493097 [Absidia repens]